jgi:hypothetical protein
MRVIEYLFPAVKQRREAHADWLRGVDERREKRMEQTRMEFKELDMSIARVRSLLYQHEIEKQRRSDLRTRARIRRASRRVL